MPMFVSIDSHSEKYVIPHILSSNMPNLCPYVSLKRERGTGNRERGVSQNRHFLQVIGCVREY